jgi:hypothetical protein
MMRTLTPARAVAAEARGILGPLAPGASATVTLAEGAFWRRESYRAVSGAANGLWGRGTYRLTSAAGAVAVTVTRLVLTGDDRLAGDDRLDRTAAEVAA